MHIIAIDNEQSALKVLKGVIEEVVPLATVHAFQNPLEALAFMKETKCEVVFLEIGMREMNGIILAKKLKEIYPKVNIVFVTEHSQYTNEVFALRASGYVNKPVTADKIVNEIENLRNLVNWKEEEIRIRTFGNFDLFVNGEEVSFGREKSKEVLAYLVDKRGESVSRRELAYVLFESKEYSRNTQNYLSKIIKELVNRLEEVGAGKILKRERNCYSVDVDAFICDSYNCEEEQVYSPEFNMFRGEYMRQYSWAEITLAKFYWNRLREINKDK